MNTTSKSKLRLLGRVSMRVLKKTYPGLDMKKPHTEWFFAGYSPDSYKTGEIFDIYSAGGGGEWNHDYKIKLLKVTDEYGRKFSEMPGGYKTICCFQFVPGIPKEIKQLPVLTNWEVSGKSIYLFQHSEINLMAEEENTNLILQGFLNLVWKELKDRNTYFFGTKDIADILLQKYDSRSESYMRQVADNLVLTGKAKEKAQDKYELVH